MITRDSLFMRRAAGRSRWMARVLFSMLCALFVAAPATRAGNREQPEWEPQSPVAVCYPVAGTGHILGPGTRNPIGALAPVFEGDTVVVEHGQVTVVDVRTSERRVLNASTRFVLGRARGRMKREAWERLREALANVLHGPYLRGTGGSVRGVEPCAWPDTVRFASRIPIAFQWCGMHPEPRSIRILWAEGGDTTRFNLEASAVSSGGFEWLSGTSPHEGRARWDLLDARGRRLGGGRFEILAPAAADSARARFLSDARVKQFGPEAELGAALLAASERFYLW